MVDFAPLIVISQGTLM